MVDPIELNDALERLSAHLDSNDLESAIAYLRTLHPADSAELLAELEPEQQAAIVERLQASELAEVFEQLDEEDMADVAQYLNLEMLADVLDEMEPDMAADLLGELEPRQAAEVLERMEEPADVASLMTYEPDTAGGIMTSAPPSLRRFWTVAESLRFLKTHYAEEEDFFYLYVLDRHTRLIGLVGLKALILANPEQTIEEIMDRHVISVRASADQEEVAQLLQRYDLVSLAVVDDDERLVGIVTIDDVVDVIEEEATEDIYHLAQMSPDSEIFSPVSESVRNRLPWLVVNLGTAFLASSVVARFEGTIAQVAVLAAFMPIVAGQGGNAGTQTMTIIVRSLALKEIEPSDAFWAIWHEVRVGVINGVTIGLLVALIASFWQHNPYFGLVIGLAMMSNFTIAAMAGVIVPMTLKLVRVDPALASGIFVTACTDIFGFLLYLGLATYFLRY
ncbi:MAG: magnesium transporter, partial [Caldilinea sp.]